MKKRTLQERIGLCLSAFTNLFSKVLGRGSLVAARSERVHNVVLSLNFWTKLGARARDGGKRPSPIRSYGVIPLTNHVKKEPSLTDRQKKLRALWAKSDAAIANGMPILTVDQINEEVSELRGNRGTRRPLRTCKGRRSPTRSRLRQMN